MRKFETTYCKPFKSTDPALPTDYFTKAFELINMFMTVY